MDIVYHADEAGLEVLLRSVDRPGDYCVHGRAFHPMPRISVDGVGALSFPVPEAQVGALIAVAKRAPYGKGPDTRVDPSVRDCWQIDAERVHVAGGAWPDTFARILDAAAGGLGCPVDRLDARLYKLLVYERGGFFAAHSDTEKVDGMVATLSMSLPTEGTGGELVIRHRGRETVVDMNAEEPSEVAFAAFYADCRHETRPVRDGHRLSLVFNLCLRSGDTRTPATAPDHGDRIDAIAERLTGLHAETATEKLVWLLEHKYTEAGLSFDALKNADAAVAQVLAQAAARAGCVCQAATVHVREEGDARVGDEYIEDWNADGYDVDDMELGETFDCEHWLDGWVSQDGRRLPFERVPLRDGELLPRGALDDARPDKQWLHEATGNEGATLERAYRRAALVVWSGAKTLDLVVSTGIDSAVAWVAEEYGGSDDAARERAERLVSRLIDIWPIDDGEPDETARADMLGLLAEVGDAALGVRFLRRVVLADYSGRENEELLAVLALIGPRAAGEFLPGFLKDNFADRPESALALLGGLGAIEPADPAWREVMRDSLLAVFRALPSAVAPRPDAAPAWSVRSPEAFSDDAVRDLFALAHHCNLTDEADAAASIIARRPRSVSPDRTLPAALNALRHETGLPTTAAYATLWRRAADALLARSATPPEEPHDWIIAADVSCDCDPCQKLRTFCKDPAAREARWPLRKELRAHLHETIDRHRLDLDHETERRGRPYILVCTKNRMSWTRRLAEYEADVSFMRSLIESAPPGSEAERLSAECERLHRAVAAAHRIE